MPLLAWWVGGLNKTSLMLNSTQVEGVLKLELYALFQRSFRTSAVGWVAGWVAGDVENIATQL